MCIRDRPTIVSIHAINVLPTEILISAYAVTTTSTSCTSARIALEANLMSLNLNQIYNSIKIHEIITAFTAFVLISPLMVELIL